MFNKVEVEQILYDFTTKIEELEADLNDAENYRDGANDEWVSLTNNLDELRNYLEHADNRAQDLEGQLNACSDEHGCIQMRINDLSGLIDDLTAWFKRNESLPDETSKQLDTLMANNPPLTPANSTAASSDEFSILEDDATRQKI